MVNTLNGHGGSILSRCNMDTKERVTKEIAYEQFEK